MIDTHPAGPGSSSVRVLSGVQGSMATCRFHFYSWIFNTWCVFMMFVMFRMSDAISVLVKILWSCSSLRRVESVWRWCCVSRWGISYQTTRTSCFSLTSSGPGAAYRTRVHSRTTHFTGLDFLQSYDGGSVLICLVIVTHPAGPAHHFVALLLLLIIIDKGDNVNKNNEQVIIIYSHIFSCKFISIPFFKINEMIYFYCS